MFLGATEFPDELGLGDVVRMFDGLFGRLLTVLGGVELGGGVDALPAGGLPVPFGAP